MEETAKVIEINETPKEEPKAPEAPKEKTKVGAVIGKGMGTCVGATKYAGVKSWYGTLEFFQNFKDGWKRGCNYAKDE